MGLKEYTVSRQEPPLQTPAQQFADKERARPVLGTGGWAGSGSHFNPERAFVKPGPQASAYRTPSSSLSIPPEPEGKVILMKCICCLPSRGSQNASPAFLDKTADAPRDIGAVPSSLSTQVLGKRQMALRETEAIWQRELTAPRTYPSQVCLNAMSSWGPAKPQHPKCPAEKWQAGQGEPGKQK